MSGLTAAQRELRRTGIGGSEIAAVLGVGTRKTDDGERRTAFDVWFGKVHPMERVDSVDAMRGIYLEPGIGDWYLSRTGRTRGLAPGTVRHIDFPVALCTPDLLAMEGDSARLVSIKAPRHAWEWGPDGTSDAPVDYVLQLQWEHMVVSSFTQVEEELDLAAFVGGELRVYHFRADRELQRWMLEDALAWWRSYMGPPPSPPPLDESAGARVWLRKKFPTNTAPMRPATPQEEVLLTALREADVAQAAAEVVYTEARRRVEQAIGEAAGIEGVSGVVTWKADARGTRKFIKTWNRNERKKT